MIKVGRLVIWLSVAVLAISALIGVIWLFLERKVPAKDYHHSRLRLDRSPGQDQRFRLKLLLSAASKSEDTSSLNEALEIYKKWAADDPDSAFENASSIDDEILRNFILSGILHVIMERHLSELPRFLASTDTSGLSVSDLAENLIDDTIRLIATLEECPASAFKDAYLHKSYHALGKTDPGKAVYMLIDLRKNGRMDLVGSTLSGIAKSDIDVAIEWIGNEADADHRFELAKIVSANIEGDDFQTAVGWISESFSGKDRDTLFEHAFASWLDYGATNEQIDAYLREVSDATYDKAIIALARTSFRNSPQQTADWFAKFPIDEQAEMIGGIATTWAFRDVKSISVALTSWPENTVPRGVATSVADKLRQKDVQKAVEWIDQLADSKAAEEAAYIIFDRLAANDLKRARKMMNTIENQVARNMAISSTSIYLFKENPESALTWALTQDPSTMRAIAKGLEKAYFLGGDQNRIISILLSNQ